MSKSGIEKKTAKAASVETAKAAIKTAKAAIKTAKAAEIPTTEGLRQTDENLDESVSINDRQKKTRTTKSKDANRGGLDSREGGDPVTGHDLNDRSGSLVNVLVREV